MKIKYADEQAQQKIRVVPLCVQFAQGLFFCKEEEFDEQSL